ncbi:protein translocase subunit SecF [Patescibacteria group bacterium]|nr:protein translocase subunit SecF [Patescibacteria group bacterium]MBU2220891.1 protein translocase subunit SecF [Patescibacteria group bacterium]
MPIITHRRIFFILIGAVTVAALAAIVFIRPQLSIEFTGGSLVEVAYEGERPELALVHERVDALGFDEPSIRESGEKGITLRTRTLSPEEHDQLLLALSNGGEEALTELRFNSIGPSLGNELAIKALYAIAGVILAIVFYIAWAFRQVSRPVTSWVYGFIVVAILIHDIIVPTGLYALWSYFTGAQVDSLFVVALLAILGYSVNDTIVIFDRVREHLRNNEADEVVQPFEEVVGSAIYETLGRSINTSVTVILALVALAVFGSAVTLNFSLVLLAGVVVGTYSSVLLAAPLLIPMARWFAKKEEVQ